MTTPATVAWRPHPGPQMRFLASSADEALYGGAAGGGKSAALMMDGLRDIDHPRSRVLFLRRTYPELREIMDRALTLFPQFGATWHEQQKRWTFPSGATYEFGYCETYADAARYQGQEYTRLEFDELGQIAEERTWDFLLSRLRSAHGVSIAARASANPGGPGHAWLKARFVAPRGVEGGRWAVTVPLPDGTRATRTRAYVPAKLADNPSLGPEYLVALAALPEQMRRQLLDGDWDAGEGLALTLDPLRHLVDPVTAAAMPPHRTLFGAFDWGFRHPFSFGLYEADEDGGLLRVDGCAGRGLLPAQIADRIVEVLARYGRAPSDLAYIVAGHDCWADHRARGEMVPTIAEQMAGAGLFLAKANISRIAGLNNLRRYLDGERPRFRLAATVNGKATYATLAAMVVDPRAPEDALKVDADGATGAGGDDAYDEVRYALASRPLAVRAPTAAIGPADHQPGYDYRARQMRPSRQAAMRDAFAKQATPASGRRTPSPGRTPRAA